MNLCENQDQMKDIRHLLHEIELLCSHLLSKDLIVLINFSFNSIVTKSCVIALNTSFFCTKFLYFILSRSNCEFCSSFIFQETVPLRIGKLIFKTFSSALLVVRAAPSRLLRGAVARILYIYLGIFSLLPPFSLI